MKKIAIIGTGPTGIYTFYSLFQNQTPVAITLYERADEAGIGMPYADEENSCMMLANIASVEIPPIFCTYLDWLKKQPEEWLAYYGVQTATMHERQFLPRIMLGAYFRDRFLFLVQRATQKGFQIVVRESCEVIDLQVTENGVKLWTVKDEEPAHFDLAVVATGHVWPDEQEATRSFFPSPWSGLIDAHINAGNIGIMGTSLSAIDAVMAVVARHGIFTEAADNQIHFRLNPESQALKITLMSRSGILPEADFYCPFPYDPLQVVTSRAINEAIVAGSNGLLDRVFALIVEEIERAAPQWSTDISLHTLTADTFSDAWFAERKKHNPFDWAEANLYDVERNKKEKHTIPWRYAILRLHEVIEEIVPHLSEQDRERFNSGLARVFIDNYTAIPPASIRRLLALRQAGILNIHALGQDYTLNIEQDRTLIHSPQGDVVFDVFIDARGQRPLKISDLPFPGFRETLAATGDDFPAVADDYTLLEPKYLRGRIAFGAIPYLMHDQPFIQGITVCAEIGKQIAKAASQTPRHIRRRLPFIEF